MNPQTTLITAAVIASVSTIVGTLAFIFALRCRAEAGRMLAVMLQMENQLNDLGRDLDAASERVNKYARRLAWLEARFGRGATAETETPAAEVEASEPERPSMTERRHRVLSLARRGLDPQTIASTLGVPHGEVDLIIGLSQVA